MGRVVAYNVFSLRLVARPDQSRSFIRCRLFIIFL